MLATHMDAECRYEKYRQTALDIAQEGATTGVQLRGITNEALSTTSRWDRSPSRRVDWDWVGYYSSFKFRYPKRFEVAIWYRGELISLSLGRPTYEGNALRLDFVEARPKDLGQRPPVFDEILVAYGVYARLINAQQIRIMHPVNDAIRAFYETFGYRFVADHDYLAREVI